ncbi:MAG: hypothetical protein HKO53_13160 [Gemmatimonadetes bacterium]|nr:hypothetical protein [Gemmatimonadota bacterium]
MAELDKVPVPGGGSGVNQPDSPYGDVVELDRLKQELGPPGANPGAPPQVGAAPPGSTPENPVPPRGNPAQGRGGESPLPGLPAGLLRPTEQPDIPPDTPMESTPLRGGAAVDGAQRRLRVISALALSDNPQVREWAVMVLRLILEDQGA